MILFSQISSQPSLHSAHGIMAMMRTVWGCMKLCQTIPNWVQPRPLLVTPYDMSEAMPCAMSKWMDGPHSTLIEIVRHHRPSSRTRSTEISLCFQSAHLLPMVCIKLISPSFSSTSSNPRQPPCAVRQCASRGRTTSVKVIARGPVVTKKAS